MGDIRKPLNAASSTILAVAVMNAMALSRHLTVTLDFSVLPAFLAVCAA
jgi:hypothetical protein